MSFLNEIKIGFQSWQLITIITTGMLVLAVVLSLLVALNRKRVDKIVLRLERERLSAQHKNQELEQEQELARQQLIAKAEELEAADMEAQQIEQEAKALQEELKRKEEEVNKTLRTVEMTKQQLAEYQKLQGTNVSEDVAVNYITEQVLDSSEREMDDTYTDCKIPKGIIYEYGYQEVVDYLNAKPEVTCVVGIGKRPTSFKVAGKSMALAYQLDNGKVKVTFKCGTAYAAKLTHYFPSAVATAKFPYGLLWYSVENINADVALELIQQVLDISYKIAKLSY